MSNARTNVILSGVLAQKREAQQQQINEIRAHKILDCIHEDPRFRKMFVCAQSIGVLLDQTRRTVDLETLQCADPRDCYEQLLGTVRSVYGTVTGFQQEVARYVADLLVVVQQQGPRVAKPMQHLVTFADLCDDCAIRAAADDFLLLYMTVPCTQGRKQRTARALACDGGRLAYQTHFESTSFSFSELMADEFGVMGDAARELVAK